VVEQIGKPRCEDDLHPTGQAERQVVEVAAGMEYSQDSSHNLVTIKKREALSFPLFYFINPLNDHLLFLMPTGARSRGRICDTHY
jgi:hypothetical protein